MIVKDPKREPPSDWTPTAITELIDHARDLGMNGNPAGYFLARDLLQPGYPITDGEIGACQTWIKNNPDRVRTVWQYQVRSNP